MPYILNRQYRLRGYRNLTAGLWDVPQGETVFFAKEEYRVLLRCDGIQELGPDSMTESDGQALKELLDRDLVRPSVFGETLRPEQVYHRYPTDFYRSAQWSVTGNCNLRCRHCFMSAPQAKHSTPTLEQLRGIADQLCECGVHRVGITGGEPLIRRDLLQLLDALCERDIVLTTLYTNGWLVDKRLLDELDSRNMHPSFQLSFDGLGTHDFLRGVDGSEDRALGALRMLQERGFGLAVSMCLHKGNVDTIRDTVKRMGELGVAHMKIGPSMEMGEWTSPDVRDLHLSEDETLEAVCDYIPQFFEDGAPTSLMMERYFEFDRESNAWSIPALWKGTDLCSEPNCGVITQSFFISAEGRVVPCMAIDDAPVAEQFPNLFQQPLRDILSSPEYRDKVLVTNGELRDRNPKCKACAHATRCDGGCRQASILDNGDYYGVDSSLCRFFERAGDEAIRSVAGPAYEAYRAHRAANGIQF